VSTSGAIVLDWPEQEGADRTVDLVSEHGVNHIDVARRTATRK